MMSGLLLAVGIGLIVYAFYKWATQNDDYFEKRNLPFKKPRFLLGNMAGLFFGKYTPLEFSLAAYNWFPDKKMYGLFDFGQPLVIVRDPQLLKQLTVKNFDHFEDSRRIVDFSSEEIFGNSLVMMTGQRWRDMRGTLSPTFTGSKMRQMFDLVSECADEMAKYFVKHSAMGEKLDVEMKNVATRFTCDVIASCAFGNRVNSFEDPDNKFYAFAKSISGYNGPLSPLITLITPLFFFLIKKFKLMAQVITAPLKNFLTSIVIDTLDERQKSGFFRPDMINVLMRMRKGKSVDESADQSVSDVKINSAGFATVEESNVVQKGPQRQWTDKEIISQSFLFFVAGFEVVSTTTAFLTYELSINPDVQQKLYEEIVETYESLEGKQINFETLQKMKYLDQVITESLRKWTTTSLLGRSCTKDFECEYGDNKKFRFEKGVGFFAPVYAIHHDPNYYPEPEKFDPERFSDENKHKIVPGTYLPFGIGPRNCIGSRFALMEVKAFIYYILLNFSLVPNAKSRIPFQLRKNPFLFQVKDGIHMELKPRQH